MRMAASGSLDSRRAARSKRVRAASAARTPERDERAAGSDASAGQRSADDDVPRHAGIERRCHRDLEHAVRHGGNRFLDRLRIAVAAADDVAVLVERQEKLTAAAVDFEDTRVGTDIKGLGYVLRELQQSTSAQGYGGQVTCRAGRC